MCNFDHEQLSPWSFVYLFVFAFVILDYLDVMTNPMNFYGWDTANVIICTTTPALTCSLHNSGIPTSHRTIIHITDFTKLTND
jgi:hypothetical protein